MSASNEIVGKRQAAASLNFFERDLTVWVALCIAVGIELSQLFPAPVQAITSPWRKRSHQHAHLLVKKRLPNAVLYKRMVRARHKIV